MRSTTSTASHAPVTVYGERISGSTHICAFFESEAEELDCVAPYFAEGLDNGELVFTIREQARCEPYLDKLSRKIGRGLESYRSASQLRQVAVEESYLSPGTPFEPTRMYGAIEEILRQSERDRFVRVRTCGDMNWAVKLPDIDRLMEYEARVNELTHHHDCTFMCVYDLNKFNGRTIMDVLSTHRMVVMGGRIYQNPYYVEPKDFLRSLASRGSGRVARGPG
jgi:hypothetical protein